MGLTLQKLEQSHPSSWPVFRLLLLVTFCLSLQRANSLNLGAVSITNKSGTRFILDSNNPCNGPRGAYVAYQICNTTLGIQTNLTASLGGLSSGFALSGGQAATQTIGTLTPGSCATLFWYVSYPCTNNIGTNITITVSDGNPGTVSASNVVSTKSSISATAGGLLGTFTTGPGLILGSTTYFDQIYELGNVPNNGFALFQPAGNLNFDASCLQLIGASVMLTDIPLYIPLNAQNTLNFVMPASLGGGTYHVGIRYIFKVKCNTVSTDIKPYGATSNGNTIKHTSNYGTVIVNAPNSFPPPDPCLVGTPEDFAKQLVGTGIGLEGGGDDWSASWGDFNNDNYPDLFVTTHDPDQPNALYRNNGNGSFSKVNTAPFSTDKASSISSSWGDYDNDGDLDLYVGNNIGFENFLYRNEGGGSFTKILGDPIVSSMGYSHGVSWADYDNDGFLDMFVAVYWETAFNLLYHNNGDGTFSEMANNAITNEASRSVSGVWADYDNDGLLDLFVANTGGQNNSLFHNAGGGNFQRVTTGAIVNDGGSSVGASWADYNNDGYFDLFVTNAGNEPCFLYKNNGNGSFTKITTGSIVTDRGNAHGSAWADWDNDGDLDLFVARDGQNNSLYRNDGNDVFTSIQNEMTTGGGLSFGSAWADYDHDGDLDLFVANREGTGNFLYKNQKGTCKNWTSIKLIGTNSNKSAIGARVYVYATLNGQMVGQMRQVTGQSGGGTGGQNEMTLKFGLNDAAIINSIIIEWPSGYEQVISAQPVNQFLQFTETDGAEVCGTVYNDANRNCQQDIDEFGISGTKIVLTPGNVTAYTDENGHYSVFVKTGTYTIQEIPGNLWEAKCPNTSGSASVLVVNLGGSYCGINFGNTAKSVNPDLTTDIHTAAHRIGQHNLMLVNYENIGAGQATDVKLEVDLPDDIEVLLTSRPSVSDKAQTLVFELGVLPPNAKGVLLISYTLPLTTPIGTNIAASAIISAQGPDFNPGNNQSTTVAAAVASFDPNDIAVSPVRYVKRAEWMEYKIRFQNVGNLPASQIHVEDEVPVGLDLSSLELGRASHSFKFQADGRKLIWTFPNINLADSLSNEAESHGYVSFRIKPDASLSIGDRLLNSASIFFDNLEPVVTNTVENVLTNETLKETKAAARPLQLFPNPSSGKITAQSFDLSLEPASFFVEMQVFDQFGRQVYEVPVVDGQRQELYLYQLGTGSYIVKAVDSKGRGYYGKVMLVRE